MCCGGRLQRDDHRPRLPQAARPPEQVALAELLANSGTQFHPGVVEVLARIIEEEMRARGSRIVAGCVQAPVA